MGATWSMSDGGKQPSKIEAGNTENHAWALHTGSKVWIGSIIGSEVRQEMLAGSDYPIRRANNFPSRAQLRAFLVFLEA